MATWWNPDFSNYVDWLTCEVIPSPKFKLLRERECDIASDFQSFGSALWSGNKYLTLAFSSLAEAVC